MKTENSQFMQLAIEKAWEYQFLTYPNPAVGATVVKDGEVLSVKAHQEAGEPHAEVLALKYAYLSVYPNSYLRDIDNSHKIHEYLINNHNNFFKECEIYVTLEPCNHIGKTPACAMLLEAIGIKKVYIGTLDPNKKASGGVERLKNAGIEVITGVCKKQTDNLLYPFTKWSEKNFTFFKLAMREDGSVDGGYITTKDSLKLVHEIRTKLDLLVIGGESVRVDRPTLDARFAKRNIPSDILIYSKQKEFDLTIPLFNVKKREVSISDKLELMKQSNFSMIEGGKNLLQTLKNEIDLLMVFISHKDKKETQFNPEDFGFEKLYSYFINEYDEVVFLK